jgi:transposase
VATSLAEAEPEKRELLAVRGKRFGGFLEQIVASQTPAKEIHIIADNLSALRTSNVREFLGRNRDVRIHYTPTYSSWLNQVEIWFSKIQRDVIDSRHLRLGKRSRSQTHPLHPQLQQKGPNPLSGLTPKLIGAFAPPRNQCNAALVVLGSGRLAAYATRAFCLHNAYCISSKLAGSRASPRA